MKVEIDQSGKIEDTNRLTVVAYANGCTKTLIIPSKDKKIVQSIFRKLKQPRIFISKVFAAAIFILIESEFAKIDTIVVDNEYPGHEKSIRLYIREYLTKHKLDSDSLHIYFRNIGRKSPAHSAAWQAFHRKRADIRVTSTQLLDIIFN